MEWGKSMVRGSRWNTLCSGDLGGARMQEEVARRRHSGQKRQPAAVDTGRGARRRTGVGESSRPRWRLTGGGGKGVGGEPGGAKGGQWKVVAVG